DRCQYHRLADAFDFCWIRQVVRVVDGNLGAIAQRDPILDGGSCAKQRQVELSLETLLNDLHVQQPEKATAKSEAECRGGLGLVDERGIVELEFLQRFLELLVLVAIRRKETRKHHRGHVPI